MCDLCNKQSESSLHLFLHCSFATSLWQWLGDIIKIHINVNSLIDILEVTNRGWSPQCKLVITSAILNIVNLIWISRNNLRFNNVKPSWNSVTALIIAHVSLTGNQTVLSTGSSIADFQILKAFKVNIHPRRAPRIIEVIWHPPILGWVKCNTDGSSLGNPGPSACGGVFRNYRGDFIGCFAISIGTANALKAELWGIIFAIEVAFDRGWKNLWIESDSMVASWALKSPSLIPWGVSRRSSGADAEATRRNMEFSGDPGRSSGGPVAPLRNRWESCLQKLNSLNFMLTHIFREGDHCADKLANLDSFNL
ncbi:hypothetical protein TSUD_284240 [Trifolium subterraneum]|uniref:RNase H type-1 domain-containing protein n=1 Tax=Trifolium subterraneum TaxID=3900 RepID=A0A2Z6PNY1_TRISU|nr:hypothetical protein TSUD_284240 [Trifolium subterraneum]